MNNMTKVKRNIKRLAFLFIAAFVFMVGYFSYSVYSYGARWLNNPYNPRLASVKKNVIAGDIKDRNGMVLATTDSDKDRVYNDSATIRKANAHVVGDNYGQVQTGAENFHAQYLLGMNEDFFDKVYQNFVSNTNRGNDVLLTVDANIAAAAYEAMGEYNGAVVLMNYQTGEVLAMVSKPTFDPYNVASLLESQDMPDGLFLNRAIQSQYPPGSVFKIVTTASALENLPNILNDGTYNCQGQITLGGNAIVDYNKTVHGNQTLKQAFANSCNSYYADLSTKLSASQLEKTAKTFGFNEEFWFKDMSVVRSRAEFPNGDTNLMAWSAIGQNKDTVTPLHMCLIAGAVANDGVMMEPKLLKQVINNQGAATVSVQPTQFRRILSSANATILKDMMAETVNNGTGTGAALRMFQACGKTGTAEIGGDRQAHSWFVGFVDDPNHPLAIAVILEEAGTGGAYAAPVAKTVFTAAIRADY